MARKQVIVQLDDTLVAALDRAAKEDGVSRSELLRRAATRLLDGRRQERLDRRHAAGYRKAPQSLDLVEFYDVSDAGNVADGPEPYRA